MLTTSKLGLLALLSLAASGCVALGSTPKTERFAITEAPAEVNAQAAAQTAAVVPSVELKTVGALTSYDYDGFSFLKYSNTTLRGYIDHLNESYSAEQPAEAIYRNYVLNVDLFHGTASFSIERDLLQRTGNNWGVGPDGMFLCTQSDIQIPSDVLASMSSLLSQLALCEGKKTGGETPVASNVSGDIETGEPHLLSLMNRGTQVLVHDIEGNYYAGYKHTFVCAVDAKRALAARMAELFNPVVNAQCSAVPDLAVQFVTDPQIQ